MKKLYLIWTLLGLLFVPFAWAQNYINGTINDETGTPFPADQPVMTLSKYPLARQV